MDSLDPRLIRCGGCECRRLFLSRMPFSCGCGCDSVACSWQLHPQGPRCTHCGDSWDSWGAQCRGKLPGAPHPSQVQAVLATIHGVQGGLAAGPEIQIIPVLPGCHLLSSASLATEMEVGCWPTPPGMPVAVMLDHSSSSMRVQVLHARLVTKCPSLEQAQCGRLCHNAAVICVGWPIL